MYEGRQEALRDIAASAKIAVPNLISLLDDEDEYVRRSATQALGNIGASAKVAIPHLILLLKDESEGVRWNAVQSLEKLGYKP